MRAVAHTVTDVFPHSGKGQSFNFTCPGFQVMVLWCVCTYSFITDMSASFRILGCSSSSPAGKFHVFILLPSSCFAHILLAFFLDISLFWIQDLHDQGFPTVPVSSEAAQRSPRYSQFGVWVGFWIDGLISCDLGLVYLLPFIS